MAYGISNGRVTDDVTWPPKVLWGSTVGYPSDSLASCTRVSRCYGCWQVLIAELVARWRWSAPDEVLGWYSVVAMPSRRRLSARSSNARPEMTTFITWSLIWRRWGLFVNLLKSAANDSGLLTYLSTMLVSHHVALLGRWLYELSFVVTHQANTECVLSSIVDPT